MARLFDDGATQYLSFAGAAVTSPPMTVDVRFKTDDGDLTQCLACLGTTGGAADFIKIILTNIAGGTVVRFNTNSGGGGFADTTASYATGIWQHATGVWSAANARAVYLEGGNKGVDVANAGNPTLDVMVIGARQHSGGIAQYMSGLIGEVVLRDVALTDSEIAVLPYVPPWKVRPKSIVRHWSLYRRAGGDVDLMRNDRMTPVNGPTWAPHPQRAQKYWLDAEMRKRRRWPTKNKPIYPAEIVWGHDTAVAESTVRNFQFNWTGTGGLQQAGQVDVESIELSAGEYMISEIVDTGNVGIKILYNVYIAGDAIDLNYRHGATLDACEAAGWNNYVGSFVSAGFVQVRVTSTL